MEKRKRTVLLSLYERMADSCCHLDLPPQFLLNLCFEFIGGPFTSEAILLWFEEWFFTSDCLISFRLKDTFIHLLKFCSRIFQGLDFPVSVGPSHHLSIPINHSWAVCAFPLHEVCIWAKNWLGLMCQGRAGSSLAYNSVAEESGCCMAARALLPLQSLQAMSRTCIWQQRRIWDELPQPKTPQLFRAGEKEQHYQKLVCRQEYSLSSCAHLEVEIMFSFGSAQKNLQ